MTEAEFNKLATVAETLVFVREGLMEEFANGKWDDLTPREQIHIMARLDDAIERIKVVTMEAEALVAGRKTQ